MIKTSMRLALSVIILISGSIGSVYAEGEPPAKAAEVNGTVITYTDFQRQLEMTQQQLMQGRPGKIPENIIQQLRTRVVDQLIAEELLYQESEKQGIKVAAEVVEKELDAIKGRFKDPKQYTETLNRMDVTETQLKAQIAQKTAIKELIGKNIASKIVITDEAAKTYFEANSEKFRQPERVRAQHILIKVSTDDDATKKADARKKVEAVQKKLLSGDDFAELAKTHSEGPSSVRGGDLGYFTRGQMVKSFEDTAFALAPNEVSEIVETQFGYHLIKVIDHQAQKDPTFDEIKAKLIRLMHRDQVQKELEPYVAKLREKAKVETFVQ
jgi:peptidyl-prolyl cis-trans isomerase C